MNPSEDWNEDCNQKRDPIPLPCDPDHIPDAAPFSLEELVARFKADTEFAKAFKAKLLEANGVIPCQDQAAAIKCIQLWYLPTDDELNNAGVPRSRHNSIKKCTDAALLLALKLIDIQE